jgi:hypothetical protein
MPSIEAVGRGMFPLRILWPRGFVGYWEEAKSGNSHCKNGSLHGNHPTANTQFTNIIMRSLVKEAGAPNLFCAYDGHLRGSWRGEKTKEGKERNCFYG